MNPLWSYLLPAFGAGLIFGVIAGAIGFRVPRRALKDQANEELIVTPEMRRKRILALLFGAILSLAAAALWHGPLGGADRFSARIERQLHEIMGYYEMSQVSAHLHRAPLTREVLLSGPADDFQRSEMVRLIDQLPGVRSTSWSSDGPGVPLIAEGLGASFLGFLLGLLVAYLLELRRRYNSQWNW